MAQVSWKVKGSCFKTFCLGATSKEKGKEKKKTPF